MCALSEDWCVEFLVGENIRKTVKDSYCRKCGSGDCYFWFDDSLASYVTEFGAKVTDVICAGCGLYLDLVLRDKEKKFYPWGRFGASLNSTHS